MVDGYAGHRFVVVAADQPPFVFRKLDFFTYSKQGFVK